ncbi:MAG: Nup85 nucleoporin-domain-containing protein [Monoraphidium minutum]|nr:MAG: Nup85 nucleoporin-domain-containing protein [Monoraphidium minutum]
MALVPAAAGGSGGAPTPPPEAIAAVPAAPGSRLFFRWGAGTQIQLCELQGPVADASKGAAASSVSWSAPSMEQRRIAYDVLPLYRNLRQALMADGGAPGARMAALRTYARDVRQILMAGGGGSDDAEEASTTPYEAGVWHLLELFFLEPEAGEGAFAELFANWLRLHGALLAGPAAATLAERVEALREAERIEADPSYWPTLRRLVAVGQLEAAGELLLAHPAYADADGGGPQRDLLERVYTLLRTTPRLRRPAPAGGGSPLDGPSDLELLGIPTDDAPAFRAARGAWARRARGLLAGGGGVWDDAAAADPEGARGTRDLLAVMLGDEAALRSAAANWAELLAALLLWRFPDASPQLHLPQLVAGAAEQMEGAEGEGGDEAFLEFFKELLLLSSQLEAQGVVRLATNAPYCGLWLVAHTYDVLRGYPRAEALFSRPLPHLGCNQAEMYTLHYVETLMGPAGAWQVAAEYLAWCPVYGADALEAMLAALPLTPKDEPSALKALALCERHGLPSAGRAACARLAARAADLGLPGAALKWALRGGDAPRAAALAAPVVGRLAEQLQARAQSSAPDVAPLDLPELDELAPLLDCLPPLAGYDEVSGAAGQFGRDGGAGPSQGELLSSGLSSSAAAAAGAAAARRRRLRAAAAGAAPRGAYAELQLLRAALRLQSALRALAAAQAGGGGGEQQQRALRAAHAAARGPVMDLLGLPLAPPHLRAPLLRLAAPLLESECSPFSRADAARLLHVLAATLSQQAAARAEGAPPDGGAGGDGGKDGGGGGGGGARLGEVRLALSRALARAHILEASAEA